MLPEVIGKYEIHLFRTGKDITNNCEKGYMVVFAPDQLPSFFYTRERGNGYVSLRVGTYIMEHSTKIKGTQVRCLRPVEGQIAGILIHQSSSPLGLEGCIAPGFPGEESDWTNSALAMESIFFLLGGFERGKKVTLRVVTNVSYIPGDATRDNWQRLK